MGNCMDTTARVDHSMNNGASDPSKVTSKTSLSSVPSTFKSNSSRSTLTLPSMKDRRMRQRTSDRTVFLVKEDLDMSTKVGLMNTRLLLQNQEVVWLLPSRSLNQKVSKDTRNG
ncbi:Os03g0170400 [Oryza sativa Japonica Group]|uniref:Os03g0170400 protein n=1 Tax=Oryza sativa subsp. japonica TaxID=39947 RepID=A0A0P0VTM1_ORYSJ|nr:hypothetical protein EE612_015580 [Oryza sativa]BAS82525.1 Os03g0170400 [Oryza sativa Japonica Group]